MRNRIPLPSHLRRCGKRIPVVAWRGLLCSALIGLYGPPQSTTAESGASLTLYNQHFGVVREPVMLDLEPGLNTVAFSEITAHLEPPSVILRDPAGKVSLRIVEQNYRNDPVSQEFLLQVFEGEEIDFLTTVDGQPATVRGRIVRAPYVMHAQAMQRYGQRYATTQRMRGGAGGGNAPIIEVDGLLRFQLPGLPLFPELGDDSIMKPTLHWTLEADQAVREQLELSYLSGGFSWEADYNWVVPEEGDRGALLGWVTMDNQSGRTFPDARIKLLAGDVSRIQPQDRGVRTEFRAAGVYMAPAEPSVEQREFDEYHIYILTRRTTLRDRETKQVEFVRADEVEGRRLYIYNGSGLFPSFWRTWNPERVRNDQSFGVQSNNRVWIYREIENTEENGLGMPLPAGRVRFYREDTDGALEFVGENEIEHTPRNETLRIYTGNAFDLVGERRRTDFQRDNRHNTITESFEIKVRNRKQDESVTIAVVEPLYRWYTWEIVEYSAPFEQLDSQTIRFPTPVDPDEEVVITYTVKYTW